MKSRLFALLLIPVCLFAFIGGVAPTQEETAPATEATKETILITTAPTIEATMSVTEPTTPETTEATMETEPPVATPEATEPPAEPEPPANGLKSLGVFRLTAYCSCQKCCGVYALNRPIDENGNEIVYGSIGVRLQEGISIAVDPRVIPYGTQVVINGHTYIAHDTGGGIKGNRIDVYFEDHQEAWNFGTKTAEVFIYE